MIAFAYYLLKVVICSSVLFLYYHLALRNKIFHQWNRFYLLASVVISLIAPIIQITIVHYTHETSNKAIELLQVLNSADGYMEEITITANPGMTSEQWMLIAYCIASFIFLILTVLSLFKILSVIRSHAVRQVEGIKFISTRVKGTPFSFFKFIFWNEEIDLQTETGQQIFQHEVVHVKENHSADKLFLQIVLIFFWCNPFFWLIKKEMKLIHEFIADKKAVGEHGTAALAAMLLNVSYPSQFNSLTNQFFQTSIKRRLAMVTKIQNPKINYMSRILALPILLLTILAFTLKTKNVSSSSIRLHKQITQGIERYAASQQGNQESNTSGLSNPIGKDTIPRQQKENKQKISGSVSDTVSVQLFIIDGKESSREEANRLLSSGSIHSINVLKGSSATKAYGNKGINGVIEINTKEIPKDPLYVLDGKYVSKDEVEKIKDPSLIESIDVLKDKSAIEKYGEKGANGVIEIKLKQSKNEEGIKMGYNGKSDVTIKSQAIVIEPYFTVGETSTETKRDTIPKKELLLSKVEIEAAVDKDEWRSWVTKSLKSVIEQAASKGMKSGTYTINVKFLVLKNGNVTDVKALNDPGYGLAEAAVKTVQNGPKWFPGIQNGKKVNSYHTQPISFVIQEQ